jgi:hypothetical protein
MEEPAFLLMMATICPVYLHLQIYCVAEEKNTMTNVSLSAHHVMAPSECLTISSPCDGTSRIFSGINF